MPQHLGHPSSIDLGPGRQGIAMQLQAAGVGLGVRFREGGH